MRSGERGGYNLLIISSQNATINAENCKEITAPLVIRQVFKIVSERVLHTVSIHGPRKRPNSLSCTNSTPHTTLSITWWHSGYQYGIFCRQIPTVHVPTTMKTSIIDKLNECVDYLSTVHPMKLPVHKIQSCFTNCVVEFVNCTCLTCIQVYVNSYKHGDDAKVGGCARHS
jgi:hypothetical protein